MEAQGTLGFPSCDHGNRADLYVSLNEGFVTRDLQAKVTLLEELG